MCLSDMSKWGRKGSQILRVFIVLHHIPLCFPLSDMGGGDFLAAIQPLARHFSPLSLSLSYTHTHIYSHSRRRRPVQTFRLLSDLAAKSESSLFVRVVSLGGKWDISLNCLFFKLEYVVL